MRRALAAFLLAFCFLGWNIWNVRLTNTWVDPLSREDGMDEAVYEHASRFLLEGADPLTPTFLHRPLLFKPPLLFWLTAASMKLFGVSLLFVRLAVLLAGALAIALLSCWPRLAYGGAGILGALLLVANPQWRTFSRVCQTDILVCALSVAAFWLLYRDPALSRRSSSLWFGAVCGLAVMAKSIYGLMPFLVLCGYWLLARFVLNEADRPRLTRLFEAAGALFVVIAPWHIYQATIRPQFFWEDYVQAALLQWGVAPPVHTSDGPFAFYGVRLVFSDPVLCVAALVTLPGLWIALRQRRPAAWLTVIWLGALLAALGAFQTHTARYALALVPALCITAAQFGPWQSRRRIAVAAALLGVALVVKTAVPNSYYWSLAFQERRPSAITTELKAYADQRRDNPLIVLLLNDSYYAATLELPEVRYCVLDPHDQVPRYNPHYERLGITVPLRTYLGPPEARQPYKERLRSWNVDPRAFGTVLRAHSLDEVRRLVQSAPRADFYVDRKLGEALLREDGETHVAAAVSAAHMFLLARQTSVRTAEPALPARW